MIIFYLFACLSLSLLQTCLTDNDNNYKMYSNHRMYYIEGHEEGMDKAMDFLTKNYEIPYHSRSEKGCHMLVAPELVPLVEGISYTHGLNTKVILNDFSELIRNEKNRTSRTNDGFSWTAYYDVDDIYNYLQNMSDQHPQWAQLVVGGQSYEGRQILGLRINTPTDVDKPVMFIESGIHAREWITPATTTYFINELLTSSDPEIVEMRDQFDWHIFPTVNPDGYHYSYTRIIMDNIDSENMDSEEEFAFETDHLALRGNKDYCDLLKFIVKLEAQKVKALKDIEELSEAQNRALNDPLSFLEEMKSGNVNFPPRQNIAEIPNIDWSSYGIDSTLDGDDMRDTKPNKDDLDNSTKVRGRKFTDSKPETFNQLWSCEEQKRLEELLEIYPEEPIEARRYKKIAEALGTRTPIQVMSRIQKYFAKLAKAGLPIPGRIPKGIGREKNKSIFYKKSTFFPQLHVPVTMEDPYDSGEAHDSVATLEIKNSNKYMLELLKAAREQRILDETAPVYQSKTMCVGCQKTGFLGARWTDNAGTDYCTDCVVKLLPAERLIPVRQPV